MTAEFIGLLADIALTLSLVVGVIFGIAQVNAVNRDRHERLTLEALRSFQTREFAELIYFTSHSTFPGSYDQWRSMTKEDHLQFIQLAQQMESLGIILAGKLIDIDLLDKTLGSFISSSWEKYKPIILQIRERHSDPYLAEYFQWMAQVIEKRMNENQRLPFFQAPNAKV